ncbi:hypothetical protein E2562_035625 [Oryza meyeriana var. granulata]|uniref:Uncharacterized protein n=1 Tax=Oryza meyeriana var. granulata TaxID=110450 RepID=A0A6G1CBE0_9ORYZ|nr:hypothetical protein E2562_035625 [Oryza meyeriana var. granulata]
MVTTTTGEARLSTATPSASAAKAVRSKRGEVIHGHGLADPGKVRSSMAAASGSKRCEVHGISGRTDPGEVVAGW